MIALGSHAARLALGFGLLVAASAAASAADLVVVDAVGTDIQPGAAIDGSKPLRLGAGARVTLVAATGAVIRLRGPYEQAPQPDGSAAAGPGVADALRLLMTQQPAHTTTIATVRGLGVEREPDDPWVVNTGKSGDRCLKAGAGLVLWRSDASEAAPLSLGPADGSWAAQATWPAGAQSLAIPADVPIEDGQAFAITVGAERTVQTIHRIPPTVAGDAMLAGWMSEKGCDRQAKALAARVLAGN